ncbi:nucleoside deaminase [Pseudodesulfovibrio pelocollis]|uniref:nucleoside deaminase n=1 Tax=Pseudodesulfovibrio pelocollis TaxID=3051432 RepID=UPI00255B1275|nr:nucleoside deaminase [Pseudodesulfovibrio sp. SB368]
MVLNVPDPPAGTTWRSLMDVAFAEACVATREGESPVGAALFAPDGALLAKAHNQPIALSDPTAHAEILCLRQAAARLGNYRLPGCILAVTLEPCLMCTGALLHARVAGVVMGALDPRAGAVLSNLDGRALPFANHRLWTVHGVMAEECSALLKRFFLERRKP